MSHFAIYQLFSDSFRKKLNTLKVKYKSNVAAYLIEVDKMIESMRDCISFFPEHVDAGKKSIPASTMDAFNTFIYPALEEQIKSKVTEEVRHLSLRDEDFEMSFLPSGKTPEFGKSMEKWSKKGRQSGRPTRILKKLINNPNFTDKDYELFNTQLKALIDTPEYEVQVVDGEMIRRYYHQNSYFRQSGTLGNSCMKGPGCQKFFDMYVEQPEIKLIVILKEEKVCARALVWDIPNKGVFLDKIYSMDDSLNGMIIRYARDHNWNIRANNSSGCQEFLYAEDEYQRSSKSNKVLSIKLARDYEYFPYMDTFLYLYPRNRKLANGRLKLQESVVGATSTSGGPLNH